MNNSKIAFDSLSLEKVRDNALPYLREEEAKLVRIIEAIGAIKDTVEWGSLKKDIFDGVVETLDRQMTVEMNRDILNDSAIYRLQGQLAWARKYADFGKLADAYMSQLTNIRQQIKIHGNENSNG